MNLARTFESVGILILLLLLMAPGAVAKSGSNVLPNIIVILIGATVIAVQTGIPRSTRHILLPLPSEGCC